MEDEEGEGESDDGDGHDYGNAYAGRAVDTRLYHRTLFGHSHGEPAHGTEGDDADVGESSLSVGDVGIHPHHQPNPPPLPPYHHHSHHPSNHHSHDAGDDDDDADNHAQRSMDPDDDHAVLPGMIDSRFHYSSVLSK